MEVIVVANVLVAHEASAEQLDEASDLSNKCNILYVLM